MSTAENVTVALILLTQIQNLAHLMAEEISEMELPSKTKVSNFKLIVDLSAKTEDLLQQFRHPISGDRGWLIPDPDTAAILGRLPRNPQERNRRREPWRQA